MSKFQSLLEAVVPDNTVPSEMYKALKTYSLSVPSGMDQFFREGLFTNSGLKFDDVDKEQIKLGLDVEMEHTKSKAVALKIALDHLAENPTYYTELKKIEG